MRKYGLIPDLKDERDFKFRSPLFRKIPPIADLRQLVTPIEQQGNISSCFGNGATTQMEMCDIRNGKPFVQLSRMFAYWVAREDKLSDDGVRPREGLKALAKFGVAREELWGYDENKWAVEPPQEVFDDALNHLIESYYRLQTLKDLRYALSCGIPVGMGMSIYKSTEEGMSNPGGMVPMPSMMEKLGYPLGGHWVVACYHNDHIKRVGCANSWGQDAGDRGFFYLTYDFMEQYTWDFWVIEK